MKTVNIYLNFNGNCEEVFKFYKSVLGGEFNYMGRYSEMPAQNDMPKLTEEDKNKIMHVGLPISKETMLMGCDNIKEYQAHTKVGNNFSIMLSTGSREEADNMFAGLSAGGKVWSPMKEEFWGDYMGMFTDKYGVNWMVSYTMPDKKDWKPKK